MRLFKTDTFDQIQAYELGWSLIGSPLMTVYCYVFDDVMMDTAQSHMQEEALEIASHHNIRRIYLTHYHEDHSGNAHAIKQTLDTEVYGHKITMEKMKAQCKILPYQKYMWGKAAPVNIKPVPKKIETALGEMIPVHTPGHSKDHLSYLIKDKGILFSGDLYLGTQIKYFRSDENIGDQLESLKKILSLDFQMLLCSHAPKREQGKERIKRKLDFLQNFYGNIILLWEKGIPEKQIFTSLQLKEDYFAKFICCGDVSMFNGVRSVIRHYKSENKKIVS
ncbi:MBL fold metallo-hydrolase [Desulfospira joergensenii]|uniref:MBL fold metallo-hydrolase n=1 Tax=Desulfospira joergensenii TaxID=53329 RepID=UPI0003B4F103|nr:MBL fold metallo-hydrolase [Desulfospira joergensenii]